MTRPTLIVEDRHSNRLGWKGKTSFHRKESRQSLLAIVFLSVVLLSIASCKMMSVEKSR